MKKKHLVSLIYTIKDTLHYSIVKLNWDDKVVVETVHEGYH